MTVRNILSMGDPRLRTLAAPCAFGDSTLQDDLADMHRALTGFREANGWGRALAAPQLGIAKRAIVMRIKDQAFSLINPEITWRSAERQPVWDDCFSLASITAPVLRHASVSVRYWDEAGDERRIDRAPFDLAELLQHEIDHLDGILFIDHIEDPTRIAARALKSTLGAA